jgi:hypothetical protein
MDHATAIARDLARRFSAGRLVGDELEAFEQHLLSCHDCQRDVATDDRMHIGFRAAGLEAIQKPSTRWQLAPQWALAASVAIAVLGGAIGYWLPRSTTDATSAARPALLVTLDAVRASGDAVITLPAGDSTVVLRAILGADSAGTFDAELRDERGTVVQSVSNVPFDPAIDPALSVSLPSAVLKPGQRYVLAVSGAWRGEYAFTIRRQ